MKSTTIFLLVQLICLSSFGAVVFVDKGNISGNEDGVSWDTAFTEIQDGVDASNAGDEIWVVEGVYDEHRSSLLWDPPFDSGSLVLKDDVGLFGGFGGGEVDKESRDWHTNETVIAGTVSEGDEHVYWVVYGAANARIDGFTIATDRRSEVAPDTPVTVIGVANVTANLLVKNCRIPGDDFNETIGLSITEGTTVENSIIANHAKGGISASGDLVVRNTEFRGNSRQSDGGGIYVSLGSGETALIQDCVFVGNTAGIEFPDGSWSGEGGAIHGRGAITIERCVFKDNRAWKGGGVYLRDKPLRVTNSIFWKNVGSGIYALGYVDFFTGQQTFLTTINNTFVDNVGAGVANDTASVSVANSLFWKNSAPGVGASEESNLFSETNPGFFAPATGDFRITEGSPAIDTGRDFVEIDSFNPPTDDIIGTPRPLGEGYDIGAYEFDPDNPPTLPEGSGGSTCFIATAAYGTPLAEEIDTLRSFRDAQLLINPLGASFVDMYYRLSPPLADFVARHGWAKVVVRIFLTSIIFLVQLNRAIWFMLTLFTCSIWVRRHVRL